MSFVLLGACCRISNKFQTCSGKKNYDILLNLRQTLKLKRVIPRSSQHYGTHMSYRIAQFNLPPDRDRVVFRSANPRHSPTGHTSDAWKRFSLVFLRLLRLRYHRCSTLGRTAALPMHSPSTWKWIQQCQVHTLYSCFDKCPGGFSGEC